MPARTNIILVSFTLTAHDTKPTKIMNNEFRGRLVHIGPTEEFRTQSGKDMISREITLATDEQFPKTACFTLRNELAQNFSHNIGETISVRFDFHARPNREGTRYYNELRAWRLN